MQLELSDPFRAGDGGDEMDTDTVVELTIIPPHPTDTSNTSTEPQTLPIKALFAAVSACSNLHPDAHNSDSDEDMDGDGTDRRIIFEGNVGYEGVLRGASDGGLPPPFPGSGGWITAENVGEFFNEAGEWIGGEGEEGLLGAGAGRVRLRDEVDGDGEGDIITLANGDEEDSNKRARTG